MIVGVVIGKPNPSPQLLQTRTDTAAGRAMTANCQPNLFYSGLLLE
jgi:hypothetical protein